MKDFIGIVLLLIGIGMIVIARPPAGQDHAPFLRSWAIGQAYVLATLTLILAGVGEIILGLIS